MNIAFLIGLVLIASSITSAQVNPACPTITVTGPAGTTAPGETMKFKATPDRALPPDSKFDWTVSAGTIESGQGTDSITVRVPPDGGVDNVHASVKVVGPFAECAETFSVDAAAQLRPFVCGLPPDDYPKLNRNDERVRLYNAAHLWANDPKYVLVFVIYLAPNETAVDAKRRASFIRDFYRNDRFFVSEPLRVTEDKLALLFATSDRSHTGVYLFPAEDIGSFAESFKASNNLEDIRPLK